LADAHPTVVLFASARPSIAFIPDETVEVTLHAVEVSSVEMEALRRSMAENLDPERLKAARCEGPIGCRCSLGLSLRDWEVPPYPAPQGAQPNEQPQECPTHVCPSTGNGS
jgi:hypothetical protein